MFFVLHHRTKATSERGEIRIHVSAMPTLFDVVVRRGIIGFAHMNHVPAVARDSFQPKQEREREREGEKASALTFVIFKI